MLASAHRMTRRRTSLPAFQRRQRLRMMSIPANELARAADRNAMRAGRCPPRLLPSSSSFDLLEELIDGPIQSSMVPRQHPGDQIGGMRVG